MYTCTTVAGFLYKLNNTVFRLLVSWKNPLWDREGRVPNVCNTFKAECNNGTDWPRRRANNQSGQVCNHASGSPSFGHGLRGVCVGLERLFRNPLETTSTQPLSSIAEIICHHGKQRTKAEGAGGPSSAEKAVCTWSNEIRIACNPEHSGRTVAAGRPG